MRVIDLFCGCGGMSLGFERAGFTLSAGFEYWDSAIACYKQNFDHPVIKLDLSDEEKSITKIGEFNPDIIIGGPPCQDFSPAGNQEEKDKAKLSISFAKIISAIKPQYFVMENVGRIKNSKTYKEVVKIFSESGYGLTEKIIDASFCGVPQKRMRFFCIGCLNGEDNALNDILSSALSLFPMTLKEYFAKENISVPFKYYYRHPRTYGRRAIFSINEPAPTIRGVSRPKPSTYQKHPRDASGPEGIEALTIQQRAMIQTFPTNFNFGDIRGIDTMIGNAVPVILAEYVANCLKLFIEGKSSTEHIGFIQWLQVKKKYQKRAAHDVVCRLKRMKRFYGEEESGFDLEKAKIIFSTKQFLELNKSVQSQIKRAYKLYDEYLLVGNV